MNDERFPWKDVAREHADQFSGLLVAGALVERVRDAQRQGVVAERAPSPFGKEPRCEHGDVCFTQAQFWHEGRLWRITRSTDCGCDFVGVDSVPENEQLPEGSFVDGNSDWQLTPWTFLPGPDMAAWDTHEAVVALGSEHYEDGGWGLHEAISDQLGAFTPSQHWRGCPSRVGGVADFIQGTYEPHCQTCGKQMALLCQMGPDADFYWADAGRLYVFACHDHPDQWKTFQDTH